MFNRRQLEILLELCENPNSYITASYFAKKQQVSLRTIQSDIKAMKNELVEYPCVEFQSVTPKGSRIIIKDPEAFAPFKENLYQQFSNTSLNYQSERINHILLLLLEQHRSISYYDVENAVFVSRSTLLNDLKRVDTVLQKYHLEILRGSNKLMIDGSEINKRRCISEENLMITNPASAIPGQDNYDPMGKIKDILVETFVSFKHNVSEVDLNNMIVQLYVALRRMENWFFIAPADLNIEQDLHLEREMAEAVFARFSAAFHLRIPDSEIDYFALYLRGRGNFTSASVISKEVDDLVLDALRAIRSAFDIDLTNDVNLRIALELHCTPMIVRIKYDMQMKNHLVDYIRQTFPQGFDIATYFASFLQKKFHKKVQDEEIAFIAIHLYKALTDLQNSTGTRRVLIISSLRRSENILIRQTLYKWFSDQIAELFFLPPSEMNESYLDRYDTILTTEKGKYYDMGLAFYINPFPDQHDYLNLKLALDGFESINDILQLFHRDLFEVFRSEMSRDDILNTLCKKSSKHYNIEGLHGAILEREALGSTFFGNGIAAPHPIFAVSSDTFISIGISPQSLEWDDDGNKVNLVMLVSVGKNNAKAFQIWNYLSKIFVQRSFVPQLLLNPSYDNFLKLLKDTIAEDFNG
ncbi:MAG: BglG family transcription antiterminator [Oscillospiraceae bacterium]|nr:BglG family transcription antiterminator [Oscillospiraceae bacterium]